MNCVFCETRSVDVHLGEICEVFGENWSLGRRRFHANCLLFASDISQNKDCTKGYYGFEDKYVAYALRLAKYRTCIFCKKKKASIECNERDCQARFHLPCALASKGTLHLNFRGFESYCPKHVPLKCIFDCDPITGIHSPFPCCNQVYSHDQCLKKYAFKAKAQFKCPLCSNVDEFRTCMQTYLKCRIFVKAEPSYAEPNYAGYNVWCAADICLCEHFGRYGHVEEKGDDFELILCFYCGSDAIHRICGQEQIGPQDEWTCKICTNTELVEPNSKSSETNENFEVEKNTIRNKSASSSRSLARHKGNVSKPKSSFESSFEVPISRRLRGNSKTKN